MQKYILFSEKNFDKFFFFLIKIFTVQIKTSDSLGLFVVFKFIRILKSEQKRLQNQKKYCSQNQALN